MAEEVPLQGGAISEVVRVGDTVRRSIGPWTPEVHAVLRHLESVGCELAPRVLGFDEQGREILTYLPGRTIQPAKLALLEDDHVLVRLGAFVAELHAALPRHPDGTMALHGDLGAWNVLVDGDRLFAIDWDSTQRGEPMWEVAYCLQSFCMLWEERALPPAEGVRRMRRFAAGYGIDDGELAAAISLLPSVCGDVSRRMQQRAADGSPGHVRLVEEEGHDVRWLQRGSYVAGRLPAWLDALGV
jgi:hypothetical protein